MRVEAWSFPNARGERLSGRLDLPDGAPPAWAPFAPCFACGKASEIVIRTRTHAA